MRNLIIVMIVFAFSINMAWAQQTDSVTPELKSKKGENILPQEGDWALGISANPFLGYLGNIFNGNTGNSSPSFSNVNTPANNAAIFGKYVVDESTFYRARVHVNFGQNIDKEVISQNTLTPSPEFPVFTEDWRKRNNSSVVLAFGIEKRKGSTRVQGLYGAELVAGYSNSSTEYQYGNPITSDFNAPITYNFGGNILSGNNNAASSRVVNQHNGNIYKIGARGFIGVEYFFAPKISLGGEFGYEVGFQTQTRALVESESWNSSTSEILETKRDVYNSGYPATSFGLSTSNLNGSINLLFYF